VVSHAYAHIVDFGEPVEVGGLVVKPGDLLHGDVHGVQSIPASVASELPAVAAKILEEEQQLIALCESPEFTLAKLCEQIEKNKHDGPVPS
jgi:regulator of RNase E activity RraA